MFCRIMSTAELDELIHQANCERAAKGAATRRVRKWLRCLYALEDPRGRQEALSCSDDSAKFLDRLYGLEDKRG